MPLPASFWSHEDPAPPKLPNRLSWRPDIIKPFRLGMTIRVSFAHNEQGKTRLLHIPKNVAGMPAWARQYVGSILIPCVGWDPDIPGDELTRADFRVGFWNISNPHFRKLRDLQQKFPLEQHDIQCKRVLSADGTRRLSDMTPTNESAYVLWKTGKDSRFPSVWRKLEELGRAIDNNWEIPT